MFFTVILNFLLNKADSINKETISEYTTTIEMAIICMKMLPALKLANSLETGQKHVISNG